MEGSVYLKARQDWDERFADLVLGKRNWQIAAAGLMAIALVLVFGLVRVSTEDASVQQWLSAGATVPFFEHYADNGLTNCIGNMIWLPTPLKGFTDAVPEVKRMLRTCAFYLYGWVCDHPDVKEQAKEVRSGAIPEGYPTVWPAPGRPMWPPGTAPFSPRVEQAIAKGKEELRRMLNDRSLANFPRREVEDVLKFWNVEL